jgi:hypothetical protein
MIMDIKQIVDILFLIISTLIIAYGIYIFKRQRSATIKSKLQNIMTDQYSASWITGRIETEMKETLSTKEKEVIRTIIWQNAQVPLTLVLRNAAEKQNILKALSNPEKFDWKEGMRPEY